MHAFDILGDPTRRRILQLLSDGEMSSGQISAAIHDEFGISQAAVSQHLRVLRENGFATSASRGRTAALRGGNRSRCVRSTPGSMTSEPCGINPSTLWPPSWPAGDASDVLPRKRMNS